MTKNGLNIQTISTKQTDFQTDRVFRLGQVTKNERKSPPFAFFKIFLSSRTLAHLVLPQRTKTTLQQNQMSQFPIHPQKAVVV